MRSRSPARSASAGGALSKWIKRSRARSTACSRWPNTACGSLCAKSLLGVTGDSRMPTRPAPISANDRVHHLEREAHPVLDRAAVGVGAPVGAIAGSVCGQERRARTDAPDLDAPRFCRGARVPPAARERCRLQSRDGDAPFTHRFTPRRWVIGAFSGVDESLLHGVRGPRPDRHSGESR